MKRRLIAVAAIAVFLCSAVVYAASIEPLPATTTLELDKNGVIRCLLADKSGVLVVLNNVEKQGKSNSEMVYYIQLH